MTLDKTKCLLDKISTGRVFLFLGFDYFLDALPNNPILRVMSDITGKSLSNFKDIYSYCEELSSEESFNKIKNDIDKIPTNNLISPLSLINWNSIYTSSIDDLLLSRMKGGNRTTKPICSSDRSVVFSRDELSVNYLFGLYSRTEETERVPLGRREFIKRKNDALIMLNKLVDSMTPMDTLLISGWNKDTDPLSSESLYQVLSKLSVGQAYIFGNKEIYDDLDINDLISEGIINSINISLPLFIENEKNNISNNDAYSEDIESFIRINNQVLELPSKIKRSISHYGSIVEDQNFYIESKLKHLKETYQDFLYDSSRRPYWKAYPLHFDFNREYYDSLKSVVFNEIKKTKVATSPIILHGPTGTGKSVALGRLCYELYNEEKYLIAHINSQRDIFDFRVIDDICDWAESHSGLTTVICWDGMCNLDAYENLSSYLSSRGRKQIVIGTSYRINGKKSKLYVEAKEDFSKKENESFIRYLQGNDVEINIKQKEFSSTFLVSLYRLLPETRFNITSGVVSEAKYIKQLLHKNVTITTEVCENVFAEAFKNALNKSTSSGDNILFDQSEIDISNIIDVVMIFGKCGIDTPFDILMRVYPKLKLSNISDVFKKIDIIRWTEDSYGDIFLSPRNTLEAEIFCKRILNNNKQHVEKLLTVIAAIEQKRAIGCSEINFCVDIVRAFGPNGTNGKLYQDYYYDISNEIGKLVNNKKIKSSKLMLLQANLIREFGKRKYDDKSVYYKEYFDMLSDALQIIEKAIDIEDNYRGRQTRASRFALIPLYGEKTSILGTLANQCANNGDSNNVTFVVEALETVKISFKYNITNYISLDSIAWIVLDCVNKSEDLDAYKLSLVLSAISMFNEYSTDDFDNKYRVDFLRRKLALNEKVNNIDVKENVIEELKELSLEDFHYYNISKLINGIEIHKDLILDEDIRKVNDALEYIRSIDVDKLSSYKLSVIHLRLHWLYENKLPLLKGERNIIVKDNVFWDDIVYLINEICSSAYNNNTIQYDFLLAVAYFNLGQYRSCDDLFRNISRDSESISGSKRVFKSFLMANQNGVRKFSGEVRSISPVRNRGEIYIDELRTKIIIIPSDFNLAQGDEGKIINDFHIAFNYLGPLADHEKFYVGSNK
ncbi:hypothetical protein [Photobacterium phosphoreum]|uniref:hypothetical protein n=1 Tax=Photobacterium phosphoreum TaxID=659 RepID=UPI001E50E8FB|nr:hypothetical protein [Photobacterium phosphoreum]MCD9476595.1 hypothetical protein [Photobacterium phosphoreum]MCF2177264.1 hypothetical protein [Photobacterium phosphoreum]